MGFNKAILRRDGTSQRQRWSEMLDPSSIALEERGLEDFLEILNQFSGEIAYYNFQDQLDGDWTEFFPSASNVPALIADLEKKEDIDAHLSLVITFLRLLEVVKKDLNKLSYSHLEFYYQKVLQFVQKEAVPDQVHVLFGLAKNARQSYLLKEGSLLNAGKDQMGNDRFYKTDRDIVINKAKISSLQSIYVDFNKGQRVYLAPVANSSDGLGGTLHPETPSWNTFGESQAGKAIEERNMVDGEVGFAIASPLLLLNEGIRTITLDITFQQFRLNTANIDFLKIFYGIPQAILDKLNPILDISYPDQNTFEDKIQALLENDFNTYIGDIISETFHPFRGLSSNEFDESFQAWATTYDTWFLVDPITISILNNGRLVITMDLNVDDPPLVNYPGSEDLNGLSTLYPALKIVFDHASIQYQYGELRYLKLVSYQLNVNVSGIRNLILQNEDGPLDPAKSFLPFGARPSKNSKFYIGSHEVFQKRLDSLSAGLEWADLPQDTTGFAAYYSLYPSNYNNINREVEIAYLQMGNWILPPSTTPGSTVELFNTNVIGTFNNGPFTLNLPLAINFGRNPDTPAFESYSPSTTSGFMQMSLQSPDFGHLVFPNVYARKALDNAVNNPAGPLPNPPYTPKLSSLELNYSSTESVIFGSQSDGYEQFFHIEPTGSVIVSNDSSGFCFPQLASGTLLIGIEGLELPQNLSLLFQVLEGSANPDVSISRGDVQWSYLKKDDWFPITDNELQIDNTQGLQTSGLLDFSIPPDASHDHDRMPTGLHWLKAEIHKDPSGVSKAIAIHPQAMSATFVTDDTSPEPFISPLAPETISKLATGASAIKKIEQPYASFGGRPKELENDFTNRISERLRHKQRAIGIWDYERIVLEAFPFIYKVKCLNHANNQSESSPGDATLIVIPDLQNKNAANPLQPKTSFVLRESIRVYVSRYIPLFVSLTVENPKYEPILVDLKVGLKPGFDGSFYGKLLNEDLKRFLSPWAFEKGVDIVFGGRIYKSSILAFIEEQPYVDYVTDFRLFHLNKSPGIGEMCVEIDFEVFADTIGDEVDDYAEASTARSILVSAREHNISVLQPGEFVCTSAEIPSGIGAMIIEYDFIVS